MFAVAKEKGRKIFRKGIIDALKKLKKDGYQIAVMSGVRSDIIFGMLKITKTDNSYQIYPFKILIKRMLKAPKK